MNTQHKRVTQECTVCGHQFDLMYHSNGTYTYMDEPCECEAEFIPLGPSLAEWLETVSKRNNNAKKAPAAEMKLINRKPYKEYLLTRILGYYETDSIVLAAVMEDCLDNLMKEVPVSQPGEGEYANMVINPRRHEAFLQKQILAFQKQGLSVPEEAVKECLATLQKQPNVLQPEQPSSPKQSSECVSREEYETMRADRDSWKDAFGESNELAAAEVKRRESVERENQRLRRIIVQHLPHDSVCALCEHFAQCKQDALEEDDAKIREETIFWNCDGFSRFVPKEED